MAHTMDEAALLGRAAEESAIRAALHDSASGPRTVALVGEAGIGKTVLLRRGIALARAGGFRVVDVPPAGATERTLLTSLLEAADRPPEGHPRTPVARRLAVLEVVELLCRRGPVLIALDDVTAGDHETLSLLGFVTRRLAGRPLVVLLAARSFAAVGMPDDRIAVVPVPPLSATAAAGLLDGTAHPPVGRVRAEVLRLAAGHPDLLTVLARTAATTADPFGPGFRWPADPPAGANRLLLVAAATDEDDLALLLTAAGADLRDCRSAEQAGLISVVAGRLSFRNPMSRLLCYYTATPDERQEAQAALVGALPVEAPLRDWHAAQLVRPGDAGAATAFERAAAACGHGLDAAAMLERAAECSRDDRDAARFYGRAAAEADRSGDITWTLDLWRRMLARSGDPVLRATAAAELGNTAMFRPGRTVLGPLNRLLAEPWDDQKLVARLLSLAARAVLSDGHPADTATLRRLINRSGLGRAAAPCFTVALAEAVADPAGWPGRYGSLAGSPLMEPVSGSAERARLMSVAGIAWVLDDTEIAADYYRRALDRARVEKSYGVSALATVVFTEVLLEGGQLDEAEAALRDATDFVGGNRFAVVRRALAAQQATLLIRRGELDEAAARLDRDAAAGPADSRLVRYLRLRAAGRLAAASGDPDTACTAFLQAFERDGAPVHFLMSQRSVVDLAAAALAAGRRAEVERVLRTARLRAGRPAARREWSWRVASALLHPDEDVARRRLSALLAKPDAADRWPYEYATAQAAYGDRLRTARRNAPARPLLVSALDIFVRVGATHEAASVREKLRAAGVRPADPGRPPFTDLTPQQQMIARLAADGLSNRDIATRIRVAPRTVSFHLYQIFPKLGISRRGQLRGVVMAA